MQVAPIVKSDALPIGLHCGDVKRLCALEADRALKGVQPVISLPWEHLGEAQRLVEGPSRLARLKAHTQDVTLIVVGADRWVEIVPVVGEVEADGRGEEVLDGLVHGAVARMVRRELNLVLGVLAHAYLTVTIVRFKGEVLLLVVVDTVLLAGWRRRGRWRWWWGGWRR